MNGTDVLRGLDRDHFWHPYTPVESIGKDDFPVIREASGVYLVDTDGFRMLDGISSWWCVNLGHCNPALVSAVREQVGRLHHSITGGMSHEPVIRLAAGLAGISPEGLSRTYFASDGASAVEAAVRMAIQYWWNLGNPRKRKIISLEGGYHGDTLGCVGLGFVEKFHGSLAHVVDRSVTGPSPRCFHCPHRSEQPHCGLSCLDEFERVIRGNARDTAAVIVEPVCQGASGMRIYPPEYIGGLRRICDENDVLLILDEIAVGFMRTGEMFASGLAGITPDLMCIGKGLTGGTLPMSAVLVREHVYDSFRATGKRDGTFYHGHTFCGNPVAASAALAALDLYDSDFIRENTSMIAGMLAGAFGELDGMRGVRGATALGCMSSLELEGDDGSGAARVAARARKMGLFIRPLGPVLYLWPPLVTTAEEMSSMLEIFTGALTVELSR